MKLLAFLRRNHFLRKSKVFCMMPWVHLHLWPDGRSYPCCIADFQQPIGNYPQNSLRELWNSPRLRAIRRNMLAEKPSSECSRCYLLEKESGLETVRKAANKNYKHHWPVVESTAADGSVAKLNLAYLDIRFSNICNFRCRTCGPYLSSAWYEDQVKIYPEFRDHTKILRVDKSEQLWHELLPHLENIERVYFAGGEPLLSEEHYQVLDFLESHKKFRIPIAYSTNLSQLHFGKKNCIDYWKRFSKIRIMASLDASGARAEYLRKGTHWQEIVKNRQRLQAECPHIRFELAPTISSYNVWHFPDFHREWVDSGLVLPNNLCLNLLTSPAHMSIQTLPEHYKKTIRAKYESTLVYLTHAAQKRGLPWRQMRSAYQSVLHFMNAQSTSHLEPNFLRETKMLDQIRSENFFDTFPELAFYRNELESARFLE